MVVAGIFGVIIFGLPIGIVIVLPLVRYSQIKKVNELKKYPLSEDNKELLSNKIETINFYETELVDYVECVLYNANIMKPESLIVDLRTDECIAKELRQDCQRIMDSGVELNPSHVLKM